MYNIGSYDERIKGFNWTISEQELGYKPGEAINIGWYCSDRICEMGMAEKPALIWEGFGEREKQYSFNDVRLAGNTTESPRQPGEHSRRIVEIRLCR